MNNLPPLQLACKKLYDIDVDYFEDIQRDCEILPDVKYPDTGLVKQFSIDYRESVVNCFKRDVEAILTPEVLEQASEVERYSVLRRVEKIQDPRISEETLLALYENAKQSTLMERISQNNKFDIITFHHALMDLTVWECRRFLESKLK